MTTGSQAPWLQSLSIRGMSHVLSENWHPLFAGSALTQQARSAEAGLDSANSHRLWQAAAYEGDDE
jgi:hypothetical protein